MSTMNLTLSNMGLNAPLQREKTAWLSYSMVLVIELLIYVLYCYLWTSVMSNRKFS